MNAEIRDKSSWEEIRRLIRQTPETDDNWRKAFALLNKRMTDRYFTPISIIIEIGEKIGEGFSIVSLQCSLIETFAAFREGKIHSYSCDDYFINRFMRRHELNNLKEKYKYGNSEQLFKDFLSSQFIFKDIFWKLGVDDGKNYPDIVFATDFYENVRCALLHDCMTKNNWVINTIPKGKNSKTKSFIERKSSKRYIYRNLFQDVLKKYFEDYLVELENDLNLRMSFARKMDYIYDIRPGNTIWWQ